MNLSEGVKLIWILLGTSMLLGTPLAFCPQHCSCGEGSSLPPLVQPLFYTATHILCNFTDVNFDLSANLNIAIETRNESTQFDITVLCRGDSTINWNDTSFLKRTFAFQLFNCVITNDDSIVFPAQTPLKVLIFKQMKKEELDKIKLQGLASLTLFTIVNSSVTKIPDLPNTPGLRAVALNENRIESVDCNLLLNGICSVCAVDLSDNLIHSFPKCPSPTRAQTRFNLRHLIFSRNNLTDTGSIGNMPVQKLDISQNGITELPTFTYAIMNMLNVSHNGLKRIQQNYFNVTYLSTLDLSYNRIEVIEPSSFSSLHNLKFLYLNGNRLIQFEQVLVPINSVTVRVNLSENMLRYPPLIQSGLKSTQRLKITSSSNPYVCDCDMRKFLKINGTTAADIYVDKEKMKCGEPERLNGQYLLHVDMSNNCPVIDSCPFSCQCDYNTLSKITFIDCSRRNLSKLPTDMPTGQLSLNLTGNSIEVLEERGYFSRLVSLYMSFNHLHQISSTGLTLLSNITNLSLRENSISQLPQSITDVPFKPDTKIYLSDNPWLCSCETLWFPEWLQNQNSSVSDKEDLRCIKGTLPKPLIDVTSDDLNCKVASSVAYIGYAVSFSVLLVIIIIMIILLVKFRYNVKVLLYTRLNIRMFGPTRSEMDNIQKDYDAFITYGDEDLNWVKETLLNRLEKIENPPYKVIIPDRDFPLGESMVDNVSDAVQKCYCALFVYTSAFARSEWCLCHFHQAYARMMKERDIRIIIITKEEVNVEELDDDLQAYFKAHTYIDVNDRLFWDKLLYVLPKPRPLEEHDDMFLFDNCKNNIV